MNKRNPAMPALPSGLVKVEKGGAREVVVGIVNGDRMPAFGFDVEGLPPNHFRVVQPGNFGILVGAKHALEVRVMLDGKLIAEQTLMPMDPPSNPSMDERVRKMMAESPQPHFVTRQANGKPFVFKAHNPERSSTETVHEQFHPLRNANPPSIDMIDNGAPVTKELIEDVSQEEIDAMFNKNAPVLPADDLPAIAPAPADESLASAEGEETATADGEQGTLNFSDLGAPDPVLEASQTPVVDALNAMFDAAPAPVDTNPNPPAIDLNNRSLYWAPSNGLVAVGVRMLQTFDENEPPMPPDAFTYVMFQLNPWDVHCLAQAHAQNRVIMPSQEAMARLMRDEGFEEEAPRMPKVVCQCAKRGCGH